MKNFFASEGIECFRELPAASLVILSPQRWERAVARLGKVESAVLFLIPYYSGQKTTNLSVYAQPRDYHLYMKELSLRFEAYLSEHYPEVRALGFADSSPLAERECALRAGLGARGRNGLLIHPRYGSYVFLGEFLLSEKISPAEPMEAEACLGCGACEGACPTGAVSDGERRECLSHVSQKKHWTEREEALMEGVSCRWGCDLCQNVCPMNRGVATTPISFFREGVISSLTPRLVREAATEERAFFWRGREILARNFGWKENLK